MKKNAKFLFSIFVITAVMLYGCSKGYEKQSAAGDLKITLTVERYPLVKSDNALSILIADSSGTPVNNVVVNARYYMPPMPGMAPMDFNTQAVLKGDRYFFSANIPMEGGWKVEVTATRPAVSAVSAIFNLDAR